VALALALLLAPLWLRLLFTRDEGRAFRLVQQCARHVLRLSGVDVRVHHLEHMPADGHAVLVSNHVSIADAAVLLAALPFDFRFVANHVFAQYPILGAAIRGASAHIVDRGSWRGRADCGHAMVRWLGNGRSLLVFPEGTTADDGRMLPFRTGAFRAAARSGRPVVPIALRGTRELLPPNQLRLTKTTVDVELLPPLVARDATREGVLELRDRTAAKIRNRVYGN
jgi:1-acyl-sn-glycerol-3-phosphate acyltransferase